MEASGGRESLGPSSAAAASASGLLPKPKLTPAQLDSQLQEAVQLKAKGNSLYREKKVRSAIGSYHRALLVLRSLDPQTRPDDAKALYRAGVASLELGDAHTAKQYLTQAYRGQPKDANVIKNLKKVEEKLKTELQKEKAMYRSMFSSSPKGEEPNRVTSD
ncbi:hypothetical protein CRUP_020136 [Coryphaenoides rupestris]|nr:hypothetical protein CRUP_020136 [Coryphaenoides rupestris]